MAVVTFGGAYAVLAYVAQQAVEHYHWLRPGEMLDGLGMAETTPGPLIMVTQFVGFMAAFRDPGALNPMLAGTLGGLLTTWVTFTPCFLWIFLGAPFIEALRGNKALGGALTAITAAVVGVILTWPSGSPCILGFSEAYPVHAFGFSLMRRCSPVSTKGPGAFGRRHCGHLPVQGRDDRNAACVLRRRDRAARCRSNAMKRGDWLTVNFNGKDISTATDRPLPAWGRLPCDQGGFGHPVRPAGDPSSISDDPNPARSYIKERNMVARTFRAAALMAMLPVAALAAGDEWSAVGAALGKTGTVMPGDVYRVGLPRTDLHVTLDGVEIKPSLALGGWLAFRSHGGMAMVMGDLVLTADEINPVMKKLAEDGIEITAVHNHLLRAEPATFYMHVLGNGDFVLTAKEVNPVLRALRENGIEVTALHNHMLDDEPRLFFMHFWANGDAQKLAAGLRQALDQVNLSRS